MTIEDLALLETFVVDNQDLERLEALLAEFNIFEALNIARQELRHSDFLAFLMDPRQNHGLGDAFLKRLLKRVLAGAEDPPLSAIEIDVADLRGALVRREWHQIDILIHDPEDHLVCAVENKIGSGEHSDQLRRYRQIVSQQFPTDRAILVFLTPEGDPPSDETFIPVSYTEIADLVDAVRQAQESTLGPDVYALMAHYTTMLRRHIVSESEIAELCQKVYQQHQRALDLIFEHRPDLQSDLADELRKLVERASPHGLVADRTTKRYVSFAPAEWDSFPAQHSSRGWTESNRILLFTFENSADQLVLKLTLGPGPQSIRKAIYDFSTEYPQVFRGKLKRLRMKWTQLYKMRILSRQDYDDADIGTLTKKVQKQWSRFLDEDLPAIRQAFEEMEWPELPFEGS